MIVDLQLYLTKMDIEEEKKPTGKLCTPTKLPGCENDENLGRMCVPVIYFSFTISKEFLVFHHRLSIQKCILILDNFQLPSWLKIVRSNFYVN